MLIDCAAITHPGRVRKNNEDSYLVTDLEGSEPQINGSVLSQSVGPQGLLAAVADGMGGAAAGEVASREGLAAVAVYFFGHWARFAEKEWDEVRLVKALGGAVQEASDAVLRYTDDDKTARGMGSTLTAAMVWKRHVYVAQIGDSRAYLHRNGELVQLTEDQTLIRELMAQGTITEAQAKSHPHRNMITQALGIPQPLDVAITKTALRRGDRLLLCSDGLHGEVSDDQIRAVMNQGLPLQLSLELLVEKAMAHGGRDNITGVLLGMTDPELPEPQDGQSPKAEKPSLERGNGLFSRLQGLILRMIGKGRP